MKSTISQNAINSSVVSLKENLMKCDHEHSHDEKKDEHSHAHDHDSKDHGHSHDKGDHGHSHDDEDAIRE